MKVICLAVTLLGVLSVFAQTPTRYVQIDYMKVQPEKEDAYLKVERELWKPVHQDRIKAGKIDSWAVYAVRFPAGTSLEYNFVTATVFPSFAAMENPYAGLEFAKIHPKMTEQEFFEATVSARDLVRSDVFELLDRTERDPASRNFLEISFMKAERNKEDQYVRMEKELWKPIHEERVKKGLITSWSLLGLRYPSGTRLDYDYATVEFHDKFGELENSYNIDMAKLRNAAAQAESVRKLVRSEVWMLLERVAK